LNQPKEKRSKISNKYYYDRDEDHLSLFISFLASFHNLPLNSSSFTPTLKQPYPFSSSFSYINDIRFKTLTEFREKKKNKLKEKEKADGEGLKKKCFGDFSVPSEFKSSFFDADSILSNINNDSDISPSLSSSSFSLDSGLDFIKNKKISKPVLPFSAVVSTLFPLSFLLTGFFIYY
jgi:hypothetical protein